MFDSLVNNNSSCVIEPIRTFMIVDRVNSRQLNGNARRSGFGESSETTIKTLMACLQNRLCSWKGIWSGNGHQPGGASVGARCRTSLADVLEVGSIASIETTPSARKCIKVTWHK